jgi:hypothetical protein
MSDFLDNLYRNKESVFSKIHRKKSPLFLKNTKCFISQIDNTPIYLGIQENRVSQNTEVFRRR